MKAISREQLRILIAAAEGRLSMGLASGRYQIENDAPPDRRERERLQKRGLLSPPSAGGLRLTEKGREALAIAPLKEGNGLPAQASLLAPSPTEGSDGG